MCQAFSSLQNVINSNELVTNNLNVKKEDFWQHPHVVLQEPHVVFWCSTGCVGKGMYLRKTILWVWRVSDLTKLTLKTNFIQIKTQTLVMDWLQSKHDYVAPSQDEPQAQKMFDGKDLLTFPGDAPSLYGRNIARVLWSKEELASCIMSPGKYLEYMQTPRVAMTPTRKALFRGNYHCSTWR